VIFGISKIIENHQKNCRQFLAAAQCFPLQLQIQQKSYCFFHKPVMLTNLIDVSVELPLHLRVVDTFSNTGVTMVLTFLFSCLSQ